ncbi:MAG: ABC transporter ATP-binding protein [Actinomycetota bacterium]
MSHLSFTEVAKNFGTTVALESFSLDVHEGELVSLLGPSGCGKTTALRIAAGFERGDRGRIHLGGEDLGPLPAHKRNMGMVFQTYSLFPNMTVAQNIEFGLRTRKLDAVQRHTRCAEVLDLVQLSSLANRYPHQLSGGQQQRVALARALAVRPDVLLLDEPLSALDAKVRETLRDEIRSLQTELGITTLFVTHDQEEALAISDRVAVMSEGRIEQIGTPVDVYRNPRNVFVARFIGTMNELTGRSLGRGSVDLCGEILTLKHSVAAGEPVRVLVRPEDVRLGDMGLEGTVVRTIFRGAMSQVVVRLDVLDELVTVGGSGSIASATVGSRVHVTFEPDSLFGEEVRSGPD